MSQPVLRLFIPPRCVNELTAKKEKSIKEIVKINMSRFIILPSRFVKIFIYPNYFLDMTFDSFGMDFINSLILLQSEYFL